jgi:hypothetical protein
MKKKEFTREQIITMLREAEVLLSQGATAADAVRKLGITEPLPVNSALPAFAP